MNGKRTSDELCYIDIDLLCMTGRYFLGDLWRFFQVNPLCLFYCVVIDLFRQLTSERLRFSSFLEGEHFIFPFKASFFESNRFLLFSRFHVPVAQFCVKKKTSMDLCGEMTFFILFEVFKAFYPSKLIHISCMSKKRLWKLHDVPLWQKLPSYLHYFLAIGLI